MRIQVITQIVEWLKANGKGELEGKNFNFNCNDDPYMRFAAEWQDWGDNQLLLIGYCFVQNGDICNDPQFVFKIENGEVSQVSWDNWTVGPRTCDEDADLEYAFNFAELVFNRHMRDRLTLGKPPHLAEAFEILCQNVQDGVPIPTEIIVPLEDENELTWDTLKLLEAVKQKIATAVV